MAVVVPAAAGIEARPTGGQDPAGPGAGVGAEGFKAVNWLTVNAASPSPNCKYPTPGFNTQAVVLLSGFLRRKRKPPV
jgi:hypothetical protein